MVPWGRNAYEFICVSNCVSESAYIGWHIKCKKLHIMNNMKSLNHVYPSLGPPLRFIWPAPFPYIYEYYRMLTITQLDKLFDSMLYIPCNFMLFDWKQENF